MSVLGFDVEWTVGGVAEEAALDKVAVAFERAGAEMVSFGRYVFPKMQPVFEEQVKEQFDAEGKGPISGAWQQLSAAYEAWKAGMYPGQPLLVATGQMRAGLTEGGSPFALRDSSDAQFNFGTQGVEYASYHQTGTWRMPARPPFDFTAELERELQRAAMEGVREALSDSGVDEVSSFEGGG